MQKSKQDYSNVDNKQRIIDAATRLFIRQGAHNTSLADIAKELDISKGTLYYYYSAKSDLIFDVTDIYMKRLSAKLLNWIKGHDSREQPAEIISVVFKTMFKTTSRGKLHIYLIYEAITHNDALKTRIRQAYLKWQELAGAFGIQSIPSLLFIPVDGKPQMSAGALPKASFVEVIEKELLVSGAEA